MKKTHKHILIAILVVLLLIRFQCYITYLPDMLQATVGLGVNPEFERLINRDLTKERVMGVGCPDDIIIFSDGNTTGLIEADIMEIKWRESYPDCDAKVIKETESISTWQNARNTLEILKQQNEEEAIIVTSQCHISWTKISFYINRWSIYPEIKLKFKGV